MEQLLLERSRSGVGAGVGVDIFRLESESDPESLNVRRLRSPELDFNRHSCFCKIAWYLLSFGCSPHWSAWDASRYGEPWFGLTPIPTKHPPPLACAYLYDPKCICQYLETIYEIGRTYRLLVFPLFYFPAKGGIGCQPYSWTSYSRAGRMQHSRSLLGTIN